MTIAHVVTTLLIASLALFLMPRKAIAHCDTMDGPTAIDGITALETGNINHAFKWIMPEFEHELQHIFELTMKVRVLSPEAKELADRYFLENLVRIHRAGEGAPFEGLLPSGTPIDEKVAAADKSIALGNLSPLEGMFTDEEMHVLQEKFAKAEALKDYDINNVAEARKYVEAYVTFFKLAEGKDHDHGHHTHDHGHSH